MVQKSIKIISAKDIDCNDSTNKKTGFRLNRFQVNIIDQLCKVDFVVV